MNALHKAIEGFSQAQLAVLLKGSSLEIHLEGEKLTLAPEDVGVERSAKEGHLAATTGEITVALDTHLSDELILEGFARELVNKINTMRRDAGFAVTDRIVIELELTDKVKAALEKHRAYIMHEVLATEIHLACENGTEWDINGESARIGVSLSIQT
jgi:isoleucyl-tRNA synthetase